MGSKLSPSESHGIFSEVLRGYTADSLPEFGSFFVKHFCSIDFADVESVRVKVLNECKRKNLPTLEEAEKEAISKGEWSESKSLDIIRERDNLERLTATKKKLLLQKEIDAFNTLIKESEEKLLTLEFDKSQSIQDSRCAEKFVNRKITDVYIFNPFFKDRALKESFFDEESFEALSKESLSSLVGCYNRICEKFKPLNLKYAALYPAFLNGYCLCKDNPFTFYGKPVSQLSSYQIEIFGYGRFFKNIFGEHGDAIPDDIKNDPEKLMEWSESNRNSKELLSKIQDKTSGGAAIIGATNEDLKKMGLNNQVVDLNAEITKKGGSLNFQDILRMHGEI